MNFRFSKARNQRGSMLMLMLVLSGVLVLTLGGYFSATQIRLAR